MKFIILLYDNIWLGPTMTIHDAVILVNDLLKQENPQRNRIQLIYANQKASAINSINDVKLKADASLASIKNADVIWLPPLWVPSADYLEKQTPTLNWLRQQSAQKVNIVGMGPSIYFLAEAGLLKDNCAVHPTSVKNFKRRYPHIKIQPHKTFSAEDNIFCCNGFNGVMNLISYFVSRAYGDIIATKLTRAYTYGTHYEHSRKALYFENRKNHGDVQILKIQQLMETEWLEKPVAIGEIAALFNMSLRTFNRRFLSAIGESPLNYLQKIKIETAKELLETTTLSIQQIAIKCGYESSNSFVHFFKKTIGETPSDYRKKAGLFM